MERAENYAYFHLATTLFFTHRYCTLLHINVEINLHMQCPPPRAPRLIGYSRYSHHDARPEVETSELKAAGCIRIFEERAAGTEGAQPVLSRLLVELIEGDMLVVVRLDQLARSTSQLVALLDDLLQRGVYFRSLSDPVDTSSPNGELALKLLACAADLERALTAERSRDGIEAARRRGKLPGNPGLRQKQAGAIKAVSDARRKAYLARLTKTSQAWLPTVREMRPRHGWDNIVRVLSQRGEVWTAERLRRATQRMVSEGLAEKDLLARTPRRTPEDHFMTVVAAVAIADPGLSLRAIAAKLDEMGERPPRGGVKWQPSTIRHLLDEAFRFGLIPR